MDAKKGALVLAAMFYLVFIMVVQQSNAGDDKNSACYSSCLTPCAGKKGWANKGVCTLQCAGQCGGELLRPETASLRSTNNIPHPKDNIFFCKMGCASSMCTNFVTKENPEIGKVGGCVDSCLQTCMAKHPILPRS